MNLNKRNYKIEIQHYIEVENEVGEVCKKWKTYKKLWSEKKEPVTLRSSVDDKETLQYNTKFVIRYTDDLNESMRIIYKGVVYDILSITHNDDINKYETYIEVAEYKEGVYDE